MIMIPGEVVAILTFPGVMAHEMSHYIACKVCNVKVHRISLFSFKELDKGSGTAGYVEHEATYSPLKSCIIGTSPFIINTLLAVGFFAISLWNSLSEFVVWLLIWLGYSLTINSIPSETDLHNTWITLKNDWYNHKFSLKTLKLVASSIPVLTLLICGYFIVLLEKLIGAWVGVFYGWSLYNFIRWSINWHQYFRL